MEIRAVIWDWDGTLVDSFFACYETTKKVLSLFNVDLSLEEFTDKFTPNWYKMYESFGLKKEHWETSDKLWYEFFDYSLISWREGALENLSFLKKKGIKQGVVTASTKRDIERESFYLKPENFIDFFICWEDSERKKPDPEPLLKMLDLLKEKPENSFYIGDTVEDIIMGKKAKVKTIGISSLFTQKEKILQAKPNYFFDDLWELLNFWRSFL